jgi:threonine aldolase
MLAAMSAAPVGDDVYNEDPTVHQLQERVADLFGFEAALFCSTGTLSNQLALRCHLTVLDEVICDSRSHIHCWENGGIHAHCGASVAALVPSDSSFLTAADIANNTKLDSNSEHICTTKLVSLENTMGGAVFPAKTLHEVTREARAHGLSTHLDGARVWNACIAGGSLAPAEYPRLFDTMSVCMSKGLGAPVGSLVLGSKATVQRARHLRKLYGGGWRQAGGLAAACMYGLDHNWEKMGDDHENALFLASGLEGLGFELLQPVETNMVLMDSSRLPDFNKVAVEMESHGFRMANTYGPVRFVTHMQTPRHGIEKMLQRMGQVLRRMRV